MKHTLFMGISVAAAVLIVATVMAPAVGAASLRVCPQQSVACPFTSIQAAIDSAPDGSTITIASGTYRENLVVDPAHTKATHVRLVGESPSRVIIDGQHRASVLVISPDENVSLVGLTLTHGNGSDTGQGFSAGGGILNFGGTVEVINSRIVSNSVTLGFGGGIFNADAPSGGGTLRLVSTTVSDNSASAGGGISTISMTAATHAQIVNSRIEDNHSVGSSPPGFPSGGGGVQNCGSLTV